MLKVGDVFCCVKKHSCERFQWHIGDSIKILVDITGVILNLNERQYDCLVLNGEKIKHRVTKIESENIIRKFYLTC